ncbi:hypothetical protein GE061_013070 [Apolygus lucorum]|uniref:CXXC-type domain-containing protein n=1 Tax=Apolygus lucorum TaxID=248454 RepID=A0A8S9XY62_APOLU|nr:hypothetical protein GE061_013070 [Apolygus lucorum]
MSEGGGGGDGGGGYPGGPAPSSTVPDQQDSKSGLPPFSSFGEMDPVTGRINTDGEALQTSRLLDISSWDYYGEGLSGRLLDRGDGFPMLIPQPQYRPWESKDGHHHPDFPGSPLNKLPSFQSQFTAFPQEQNGETVLTTLTPAPASPNSSSSGLPSFHTLSTVPPRGYPLVPAPVQAREIPSIQQQILDERHIHLFQGAPHQQYHQLGAYQPQQQATLLTVVKTEPLIVTQLQSGYEHHQDLGVKMEDANSPIRGYLDSRKKERRKIRASSMESSNESDGVGSSSVESSGQVAAISSTAGFKSPLACHQPNMHSEDDMHDMSDKPVKKKRKRCGECIGCQRKDNCGDCAPCRNDKSHQICKMRRCEKLTEKKTSFIHTVNTDGLLPW